jgi:hypothetical protein
MAMIRQKRRGWGSWTVATRYLADRGAPLSYGFLSRAQIVGLEQSA